VIFQEILRADHIYLKQLLVEEVNETYVNWLKDPAINKFLEVRHNPPTLSEQIKYVLQCIDSKDIVLFGIFLINNRLIGTMKLSFSNTSSGEIGIMVGDKSMQGIGIGKSAVGLIKAWAIKNDLLTLTAGYDVKNIASAKLFKSLGFKKYKKNSNSLLANQDIDTERVLLDLTKV
jgi:ribosomal-protein-alanine N-acetyltransferase